MPFAEDLLEQAGHLAKRERTRPRQASLRRAVSTAYYALFHLLVHDATKNWKRPAQRALLARAFEHGKMKAGCDRRRSELAAELKTAPRQPADELAAARCLHNVVDTFILAQQQRHAADYDNAKQWTRTAVRTEIMKVSAAFQDWKTIRDQDIAQDFLAYLLVKDR